MAVRKGTVDVSVGSGSDLNNIGLSPDCGGAIDNGLSGVIPNGTIVTLRRGGIKRKVKITIGDATECVANTIQVSRALAKLFGLRNQARFLLAYNTATKTLTMRRKPVTIDTLTVTASSAMRPGRVTIGLGLAQRDGNYLKSGSIITIRHGRISLKLRMVLIDDIFNNDFTLRPRAIRLLGLRANNKYRIAYNQVKRELVFIRQVSR
ncbi:hypothetical protein [Paenibacillus hamazuiensis]|uniref:hypothetical protein n=1 Tax=Paenibacillus hamazuiensis TaxID=2936508 RepID=UPI00200DB9AD|nr:hypothetical protein [Paenibacillus hamazuiensis]